FVLKRTTWWHDGMRPTGAGRFVDSGPGTDIVLSVAAPAIGAYFLLLFLTIALTFMVTAIVAATVRPPQAGIPPPLLVLIILGGEWAPSRSGETVPDRNPAHTDEILGEVTVSTADDVRRAVDAAAAAFREWRATPSPQRGDIVRKAADQMERRRDELGRLLTQEEGKTL